jgi:hypothetical protein
MVHNWLEPRMWPSRRNRCGRRSRCRRSSARWWRTSTIRHDMQARCWTRQRRWRRKRGLPDGGPPRCPQASTGGGLSLGDFTGSDRRGAVPSGSDAPLATPPLKPAVGGHDHHPREPLTYPTHHTRVAQRAAAAARRKEHRGPPRPTKRGRI